MRFLIVALFIIGTAYGQSPKFGSCPKLPSEPNFVLPKYLGKWYAYAQTWAWYQMGLRCNTATYSMNSNGTVRVYNKGVNRQNKTVDIVGWARQVDPKNEPGRLEVKFPQAPAPGPYQVLASDLENYSIVFSCRDVVKRVIHLETLWVLTRQQYPSPSLLNTIKAKLNATGLNTSGLKKQQVNCPPGILL